MDNNKIVDNLNFIKIYFRVFIYKIIIPEKAQIIQKRDQNHRIWVKTHLGARADSRKPKKAVQNAPEHESRFDAQECHLALAEFYP